MRKLFSAICAIMLLFAVLVPSAAFAQAYESGENAPGSTYEAPEATYTIPHSFFSMRRSGGVVAKADFIFFIDSTGSMRSYINSVKSNLTAFSLYLEAQGVDVRFSVVDFKDITSDGASSTVIHKFNGNEWTSDPSAVETVLGNLSISGGGDTPETPTNALAVIAGGYTNLFRDDASKFAFLLTDAGAKSSADSPDVYDMEVLAAYLRRTSVYTSVVSKLTYENHYKPIYEGTGGIFIDIDSVNYFELMLEVADWVVEASKDTDGDGLPDKWETDGVDANGDGVIDLDLKAMGADPNVPDIFVEVDWMYKPETTSHFLTIPIKNKAISLRPSDTALKIVTDQFADHGIQLHIDAGADSVMNPKTGKTWGNLSRANTLTYSDNFNTGDSYENWNQLAVANFDSARWNVFRYCICVNKYNGSSSSGLAEGIPGQFFIVADTNGGASGGVLSSDRMAAGTFMHEMGHTLGLHHGGDDDVNYKANYLSIMNYYYQFSGLLGTNETNYSEYELPAINESSINENNGLDPNSLTQGSGLGAKWNYDGLIFSEGTKKNIAGVSIDFNNNWSVENSVSIDLNNDGTRNTQNKSINDWDNIIYKGGAIGGMGASAEDNPLLIYKDPSAPIPDELSLEEAEELGLLGNPDDCDVVAVTPGTLYAKVNGQNVDVTVKNLTNQPTTVKLVVKSTVLADAYEATISLQASEEKVIELAVPSNVKPGRYTITCELECANGDKKKTTAEVEVYECEPIVVAVGQTIPIEGTNLDGLTPVSTDSTIVNVNNGQVTGMQIGNTFITMLDSENNVVSNIPVEVVESLNHPQITLQPMDQYVVVGQRGTFTIQASGDGLTYQWYINRNNGNGWRKLDGAIGTAYTTSETDLDCDGFRYYCQVKDKNGNTIKSNEAVLHVTTAPVLPETGDSSTPVLWLAMSMLSILGVLLLRKKAYAR